MLFCLTFQSRTSLNQGDAARPLDSTGIMTLFEVGFARYGQQEEISRSHCEMNRRTL